MNEPTTLETVIELEPERYELREAPAYQFDLDRRDFLRALGGGILVFYLLDAAEAQPPGGGRRGGGGRGQQNVPQDIGAWLHIGEDGQITVYTGKAEVGQNIRTSLTQVVAEELHVPPGWIRLVMADTQLVPFDMGTFGSRTTPDMSRRCGHGRGGPRGLDRPRNRDLECRPSSACRGTRLDHEHQDAGNARVRQLDQGPKAHQGRH